ncbi:terpene synthase family protein [Nonomuraea sp. LPB2021202275-12-8]|uniref:terpene synthase family protein n=1 Tax=Nonomuraea sp. LPB2021202275-12-8 TaxID=3120159 RepID=UPI00300C0A3D
MSGLGPPAYFELRNDLADSLLRGSHQLAGVPRADRDGVLQAALDAVPEAAALLRPYPALYADGESSASRLAFSCLSAAATFPLAGHERIADLGALTVILFGVDDIADSVAGEWSEQDFSAFSAELPAILTADADADADADGSEGPTGQIQAAWAGWCRRFHRYPAAAVHVPNLARQLELAGAAMARERAWAADDRPWPTYADYLANGMITILYPTWWAAALAVCGPAAADSAHWKAIEPATLLGASCVRLANDIRTFEREKSEGKPNSISIQERAGTSAEAAVGQVAAHIDELDAAFDAALADLPDELLDIADGQRRSVSFNGRWYLARDTHAYTVRELARDAGSHQG